MVTARDLVTALEEFTENSATPLVLVTPNGTVVDFDRVGFLPGEGIAIHTKRHRCSSHTRASK